MERMILHVDMNSFYASVECLHRPDIRHLPVAVGGDEEARHGIVLAKNQLAKAAGVKTGEVLWQARQKCPGLVTLPPNYPLYLRYSEYARALYERFTNQIEPFGLDECWLDVTGLDGFETAERIRKLIFQELGVTVSVGVSWNKIFAKLGSDVKKPDATTVISRENYKRVAWPLAVSDLLYVGSATTRKLNLLGVRTIGDLARLDAEFLLARFGKVGLMLSRFANGEDTSPVMTSDATSQIKSIGNSVTTPRDLSTDEDVRLILYALSESVGARLREHGLVGKVVELSVRDTGLFSFSCQHKIVRETFLTNEIAHEAVRLFHEHYSWSSPIRSMGVRVSDLSLATPEQLAFFPGENLRIQQTMLDHTIDDLRRRYGYTAVMRGLFLADRLGELDAKSDHIVAPISFLKGGDTL